MTTQQEKILPLNLKGGIPKRPRWADANSITSFKVLSSECHWKVFDVFMNYKEPLTDRQVMKVLGYVDPNKVRPRISELLDFEFLLKVGNVKDVTTGLPVRQCKVNWRKFGRKEEQLTLPIVRKECTNARLAS